jgi:hypothetical protein
MGQAALHERSPIETCLVQTVKQSSSGMVSPKLSSIAEIIRAVLASAVTNKDILGVVATDYSSTICTLKHSRTASIVNRSIIQRMSQCIQNHFVNTEDLAFTDERCGSRGPHGAIHRGVKIVCEPDDERLGAGLLNRIGRFNSIERRYVHTHQYDVRLVDYRHAHRFLPVARLPHDADIRTNLEDVS